MSIASGREIYVLGQEKANNREVIVIEDGESHDLPAGAEYTYESELTQFPYSLV